MIIDVTNEVQKKGKRLYEKLNERYTETFIGDSMITSFHAVIPDICTVLVYQIHMLSDLYRQRM